jgi:acetate---CoA ligase (ADP-forming)
MMESSRRFGAQAVARMLRPRSVAIIGASRRPDAISQSFLLGLKSDGFQGPVHLVGKSAEPIDGHAVLTSPSELPPGVDLAIITLPAASVRDVIADCVGRQVGAALVLAAGFAEVGSSAVQDEVAFIARDGGLAICGPNCIGFTNNVDGLTLHMRYERVSADAKRLLPGERGIAFVGQSGGVLGHMQRAARAREMPMSYVVSTGNEAGLDLADYLDFMVQDAATAVIALYAEQIRRPRDFLAACALARQAGKHILLLHPGRNSRARAAAQSHTGALVGDHSAMMTQVTDAGVLVVETTEEMIDVGELLLRHPHPPTRGPAILTASGAMVALVNDFSEDIDLELPQLTALSVESLAKDLPPFGMPGNPFDTTAGLVPGALTNITRTLLADANIGSLLISFPIYTLKPAADMLEGVKGSSKPVVLVPAGDGAALPADIRQAAQTAGVLYWHSTERALRALSRYTQYGRLATRPREPSTLLSLKDLPALASGPQAEWAGKKLLAAAGIATPQGALARTEQEALAIARDTGYPVVLKAQAARLLHKTEAGGVILGIADDAALRAAWQVLHANINRADPTLVLDGVLIERMAPRGLELMIGAKRDPQWGPVLLLGLGGIWAEALSDVKLLPISATREDVIQAFRQLRAAVLLAGFRGAPPVDIDAVASVALCIASLMQSLPSITEIEINPLVAYPQGQGATALDALVVMNSAADRTDSAAMRDDAPFKRASPVATSL